MVEHSKIKIRDTPWVSKMEGFIIPSDIHIPENYQIISELMEGGSAWNQELVRSLFPPHVSNHILNTPIFEMEQERLIWTPSSTGGKGFDLSIMLRGQVILVLTTLQRGHFTLTIGAWCILFCCCWRLSHNLVSDLVNYTLNDCLE